eukprot:7718272-Ditylum_brightwellii.AAC.1
MNSWAARQINFVIAYSQVDIEYDLFLHFPHGVQMEDGSTRSHILTLLKNVYGQKKAGIGWYNYLKKGFDEIGFEPSVMDEWVFYRGNTVFLCYVYNYGISASPNQDDIDQAIKDLKSAKFGIENKGNIEDYLEMTVDKQLDERITIPWPQIIQSIIDEVPLPSKLKNILMCPSSMRDFII